MINKKTFEKTEEGLIVRVKIIPNASKNELIQTEEEIKVRVTAQPIENKANKAIIEFFSKTLKTAKSNIKILKGELNKEKTLLAEGIDEQFFKEKFNIL